MAKKTEILNALTETLGEKAVISEGDSLASRLTDWRGDYHGSALALLRPADTNEVSAVLRLASKYRLAIVPQGGNTSLCGAATPDTSGQTLILSLERMNRIREIDPEANFMTVEAGCILQKLHEEAARHDRLFPLNLGARGSCSIGGNLSTNAGGLNVLAYGNTRDLTMGLEVVLADGKVLPLLSSLRKDNTGYDLKNLFIGAEGTLGVITAATLKLFPAPKICVTGFAGIRDINAGITLLNRLQTASGGKVTAFELMPKTIIDNVLLHYPEMTRPLENLPRFSILMDVSSASQADAAPGPDGSTPLNALLEEVLAEAYEDGLVSDATVASSSTQQQALWAIREATPEAEVKAGRAYKADISIPLRHMQDFYDRAYAEAEKLCPGLRCLGFGHLGDGNLHYNLGEPPEGREDFAKLYPAFDAILIRLLGKLGGSVSAEHGIGQKKLAMMEQIKDPVTLSVMAAIKTRLDPMNIMNPGKVLPPPALKKSLKEQG